MDYISNCGRISATIWRSHRATIVAFSILVLFLGFVSVAKAQNLSQPSFKMWACDQNAACMNAAAQNEQWLVAQNAQIAMQRAAAQSQVNSANECVSFGGQLVPTGPNTYTCQKSGQVIGSQVGLAQPQTGYAPQGMTYAMNNGQTANVVQGQYPVCVEVNVPAPSGAVMLRAANGGAVCTERMTNSTHNCNGGFLVFWPNGNPAGPRFMCQPVTASSNGYGMNGNQSQGYVVQQQPMYPQQQRQPQNILGGALDGAMIGYAAQGNRDGLRDGAVAGASRAVIRNILGF